MHQVMLAECLHLVSQELQHCGPLLLVCGNHRLCWHRAWWVCTVGTCMRRRLRLCLLVLLLLLQSMLRGLELPTQVPHDAGMAVSVCL